MRRKPAIRQRAIAIYEILVQRYGIPKAFLNHETPFQLLIATIMSAQCTDARVNQVTPKLFARFPDARSFAKADSPEVFELIKSISFGNTKSKNIVETARKIVSDFNGEMPTRLEELISLPGVGRKTANVVLGQAFEVPGITVDTHVNRLANRLGFSKSQHAEKIEKDLMLAWPEEIWTDYSSVLILHARSICIARKPECAVCPIASLCPSAEGFLAGTKSRRSELATRGRRST